MAAQRILDAAAEKHRTDQREVRNPKSNPRNNPKRVYVDGQYVPVGDRGEPRTAPVGPRAPRALKPYVAPEGDATTESVGKVVSRVGQQKFAKAVFARDGQKCAITRTPTSRKVNGRTICSAAHIKPFALCSAGEYMDLDNGITLRNDIHAAFDNALFYITRMGYVITQRRPTHGPFVFTPGQHAYLTKHRLWVLTNWRRWQCD